MKHTVHNKKLIHFAMREFLDDSIHCLKCILLIFNKEQITEKSNVFFKEKNNILKPNKIKTALSFKARSVELAASWLTPVFSIFSVLRTLTGNGQPGDTMKGNSAVKVSLITCDLKSVNGPNGHSLAQAKAYNNPKAPLKSGHKSTGRMVLDTGGRAEYFPTNS